MIHNNYYVYLHVHIIYYITTNSKEVQRSILASQHGQKEVVELLLNSGASVDKPNMITYRLALTRTLRKRVCVPHCISHVAPWDPTGQHCIVLL